MYAYRLICLAIVLDCELRLRVRAKVRHELRFPRVVGVNSSCCVDITIVCTRTTLGNMSYADGCAQFGQKRVDEEMQKKIREDVQNILLPMLIDTLAPETAALFKGDYILHVNPTGKFVIGEL